MGWDNPIAAASSASSPYVWRGIGQAMSPSIQGYGVGTGISQTYRSRHSSEVRFRQVRACLQTFAPLVVAGVITDLAHPFGLQYQCAFEQNFNNLLTGLAPRVGFTFSGSPTANYAVITGVSVSQGSNAITCTNILGNIANGQPVFNGTSIIGYIQTSSGTTSITLTSNYTGTTLAGVTCTSNNGATQQAGYILSDILDLGTYYTPGTTAAPNFFGLHTTVEIPQQNIITGGAITTGTNAFTCTSVSGNGFGQGSPVYTTAGVLVGTVATVVSAGTSYTLSANYTGSTLASQTMYSAGLPYQRGASSFLQRYVGSIASTVQATGTASATASNSVAVTTGANWAAGMNFVGPAGSTIPAGTYVLFATAASGSLTLTLNNPVTVSGSITGVLSNIASGTALSGANYNAPVLTPSGQNGYFTPAMLVVLTNSTLPFVCGFGDSIAYGSDEGGYSNTINGTVAANILTVNSGFQGSAICVGMTFYNTSRALTCTVISNISGAGNGSTWNVTTAAGGTAVSMYGTTSGTTGDSLGSALGNCGWLERGVHEVLGYPMVNLSRGSDANYMLAVSSNWQYRQQLLQLANPTHVVSANIHNDISNKYNTVAPNWAAFTAFTAGVVIASGGNDYLCTQSGTSGNVALSGTTYGANIIDGTCVWQFLFTHIATTNSRGSTLIVGYKYLFNQKIRQLVPGANIVGQLPTPDASSTDQYSTAINQAPTTNGWALNGGSYSTRSAFSTMMGIPAIQTLVNWSAFLDPSTVVESGGSQSSGVWSNNGTPYAISYDGTHPNSYGYSLAAAAVVMSAFSAVN